MVEIFHGYVSHNQMVDPQQPLPAPAASKALDEQHRLEGDLRAATAAKSRLGRPMRLVTGGTSDPFALVKISPNGRERGGGGEFFIFE